MKLPSLTKSSNLGSGPELGLAKKGESIANRPLHTLERRIAPKVLGGQLKGGLGRGHGAHIKGLAEEGASSPMAGAMPSIPGIGE